MMVCLIDSLVYKRISTLQEMFREEAILKCIKTECTDVISASAQETSLGMLVLIE